MTVDAFRRVRAVRPLQQSSLQCGMRAHPSTPPVAFYLLAAGGTLAVLSLVLALLDARLAAVLLTLGVGLGVLFATNLMVAGGRRQWDHLKR